MFINKYAHLTWQPFFQNNIRHGSSISWPMDLRWWWCRRFLACFWPRKLRLTYHGHPQGTLCFSLFIHVRGKQPMNCRISLIAKNCEGTLLRSANHHMGRGHVCTFKLQYIPLDSWPAKEQSCHQLNTSPNLTPRTVAPLASTVAVISMKSTNQ